MTKVDLITGFLGSGKTTFIKKYIAYLKRQNQTIRIIENEFGPVTMDADLLKNETSDIQDLSGKCMCCVGKEAFRNMLIEGASQTCDRIIVEPSGIYDVDEFFDVMFQENVKNVCEIGSIITIVDPCNYDIYSDEAKYLMFSQLLASNLIIMSKTQYYEDSFIQDSIKQIKSMIKNPQNYAKQIYTKNWNDLTDTDFETISHSGYSILPHERTYFIHQSTFSTCITANYAESYEDLKTRISSIFSNTDFGHVLRIKGYLRDLQKQWYEVNCTRSILSVTPVTSKRGILVIIGENLNESLLKTAFISLRA